MIRNKEKTYDFFRMFFCYVFTLAKFYDILNLVFAEREKKKASDDAFLARCKGLEPLTYWFVASHSIQLS